MSEPETKIESGVRPEDFENPEFVREHWDKVYTIDIGGKSAAEYETLMEGVVYTDESSRGLMKDEAFTTLKTSKEISIIRLSLDDLGFYRRGRKLDEVCERAKQLGLELCPPEAGPAYSLVVPELLPIGTTVIPVKEFIKSPSSRRTFEFRNYTNSWMHSRPHLSTTFSDFVGLDDFLLFRLRKVDSETLGEEVIEEAAEEDESSVQEKTEDKTSILARLRKIITG